jgi:neurofibromin 1
LLEAQDIAIPRNSVHFVTRVSKELAESEPKLTLEFLLESLHGITKADKIGEHMVLQYIRPWIGNLAPYGHPNNQQDSQEKINKVKEIINSLVALSIRMANEIGPLNNVWKRIGDVTPIIPLVFECLLERAGVHMPSKQSPIGMKMMDCLEDIAITLAAQNRQLVSGKIISSLLVTLESTFDNQKDRLDKHDSWTRIEVLLRWLLTLSFENLLCVELYTPELFHIITMTFGMGDSIVRSTVHGLFMNIVHSLYTSRVCQDNKMQTLRFQFAELHNLSSRLHFGISTSDSTPFSKQERDFKTEKIPITMVENVASSLMAVMSCCTPFGNCIGTPKHARWLSLTSLAAFAPNPCMQARAIVSLGVLCQSPDLINDELVGMLLALLKSSLIKSAAVSIRCIVIIRPYF